MSFWKIIFILFVKSILTGILFGCFLVYCTDFFAFPSECYARKIKIPSYPDNGCVYLMPRVISPLFNFKMASGGRGVMPIVVSDSIVSLSNVDLGCLTLGYYKDGMFHSYDMFGNLSDEYGFLKVKPIPCTFTQVDYRLYQFIRFLINAIGLLLALGLIDLLLASGDYLKFSFKLSVLSVAILMLLMYHHILLR